MLLLREKAGIIVIDRLELEGEDYKYQGIGAYS
jgi:hypothetical protein